MRKVYNKFPETTQTLNCSKKFNVFESLDKMISESNSQLQIDPLDVFIEKCSKTDIKIIFEFLQAAKLSKPDSQETNSVINSLLISLSPIKILQTSPDTNQYFADSIALTQRNESIEEVPQPEPTKIDSPLIINDDDDDEEYIVRRIRYKPSTSPKIFKAIQKKKPFVYDSKSSTQVQPKFVDLT